ncbi:MAG: teichoic acid biosynthesis protein [Myxococcales bacterium]|nr:teichoic acid biosynthesis protein [Myxococcales bacterium]
MRVLYGVVGEGMGHAVRSRVVIAHLLQGGHSVHAVASSKAYAFLRDQFADDPRFAVTEIAGLVLVQHDGVIDKSASLWKNLGAAPEALKHNLGVIRDVARAIRPDVVISDYDSWAYSYALAFDLPVVSLDNIQILDRCEHDPAVVGEPSFSSWIARMSTKVKLPGAWHYLVTTFFYPEVRKKRTTLVPPILRPEILAAAREPGEHVLVYQHTDAVLALLPALRKQSDVTFRVYGSGRTGVEGNLDLRPFSQQGFVDDLRTARAAIAGGGFTLMGECVHLGVPLLSVPLAQQAEQALNGAYLAHLGYGASVPELDDDAIASFLGDVDRHTHALAAYDRQDNARTLELVDALLGGIARGEPRPDTL